MQCIIAYICYLEVIYTIIKLVYIYIYIYIPLGFTILTIKNKKYKSYHDTKAQLWFCKIPVSHDDNIFAAIIVNDII